MWTPVYERFWRGPAYEPWGRLLAYVQQHWDAAGTVDCAVVCIDSPTVRAHPRGGWKSDMEALGARGGPLRPRRVDDGGFVASAGQGRLLCLNLTVGNVNDFT